MSERRGTFERPTASSRRPDYFAQLCAAIEGPAELRDRLTALADRTRDRATTSAPGGSSGGAS